MIKLVIVLTVICVHDLPIISISLLTWSCSSWPKVMLHYSMFNVNNVKLRKKVDFNEVYLV